MLKTYLEAIKEIYDLKDALYALKEYNFTEDNWLIVELEKKLKHLNDLYNISSPFKVGETYTTMSGDSITLVEVFNERNLYETMVDQNGVHRYTTRDFGRVTGSKAEDNADNIDLRLIDMIGFAMPIWYKETVAKEVA